MKNVMKFGLVCAAVCANALVLQAETAQPVTLAGTVLAREINGLSYEARGCIVAVSDDARRIGTATEGQVLVELDDQLPRLALATARARIADLEAAVDERDLAITAAQADEKRRIEELEFVKREFTRSETMFRRGLINETAMEAVERRMMDANFAVDRAGEALASATSAKARAVIALDIGNLDLQTREVDLDALVLRAPYDGVLLDFQAKPGDCVQQGALAAQFYAPSKKAVEVFVHIDLLVAAGASGVSMNAPVVVSRVNGDTCPGAFTWIGTEANLETQYIRSTIDLDESCAPEMFLNEAVEVQTRPGESG